MGIKSDRPVNAFIPRGSGQRLNLEMKPVDRDVYSLALERTEHVMSTFDKVFVSFSGGKDSTSVLNIALEVAHSSPRFARHLPLRAVFWDEEAIPYETEEYVRRVSQRDDVTLEWYCLPVEARTACTRQDPFWYTWAPEEREMWCRPLPPEAITQLAGFPAWPREARISIPKAVGLLADPADGNTADLLGIRADESMIRRSAVRRRKVDNYIIQRSGLNTHGNVWKAYPIYDWSTEDNWTAAALKGWDYNRAYDLMEMAGLSRVAARCSPAFGEEPIQKLWIFQTCFPELWDKMTARVPGAAAAARYARTELYGFTGKPAKPDDMTWPEFILHYLELHAREQQPQVAARISTAIRVHYKKSDLPVLPDAACPPTGLSWNFLLAIAMRGDFRNRRQAHSKVKIDDQDRGFSAGSWQKYIRELTALQELGVTPADLGHPGPFPHDPYALLPDYAREDFVL